MAYNLQWLYYPAKQNKFCKMQGSKMRVAEFEVESERNNAKR